MTTSLISVRCLQVVVLSAVYIMARSSSLLISKLSGYEDNFQKNVISRVPGISISHKVVEGHTCSGGILKGVVVDGPGMALSQGEMGECLTWWFTCLRGTNKPRDLKGYCFLGHPSCISTK